MVVQGQRTFAEITEQKHQAHSEAVGGDAAMRWGTWGGVGGPEYEAAPRRWQFPFPAAR